MRFSQIIFKLCVDCVIIFTKLVWNVLVFSMWRQKRNYYGNIVMRKIGGNSGKEEEKIWKKKKRNINLF
jgi:hypothetical protein